MGFIQRVIAAVRNDGWSNALSGVGTRNRDKTKSHLPCAVTVLTPDTLDALWHGDDLAQRIVKDLVEDALRQGFEFADEDDESEASDASELNKALSKWGIADVMLRADIWGRLYGAGFIMLGVDGAGLPNEPLDDERVPVGGLKFLEVYDRRDVVIAQRYMDALSPKFDQPELYRITGVTGEGSRGVIHETRMIRFDGSLTSRREKIGNQGWDHSVLQRCFDVLQQCNSNWQSIGHLMSDFGQGVFKIKNLIQLLAAKEHNVIQTRMELLDMGRSTARAIMLDADKEDFERKATPLQGASDMLDRSWQRLSASAEEPLTRLFGMSPSGLNATGESDIRLWYDRVQEHREKVIGPRLERAAGIVARSEGIAADGLALCWPSLWQQTPAQEEETEKKRAETDKIYIDAGVVLPEEIALSRWGRGAYSRKTTIDLDVRKAVQAAELKKLEEGADPTVDNGSGQAKVVQLTPTDVGIITTVNEARAAQGLGPLAGPDGDLTIAEFKAKHTEVVAQAANAEAGNTGKNPAADKPPPTRVPG